MGFPLSLQFYVIFMPCIIYFQIYFTYCANNLFTHWSVSAYVSGDGAAEQGNSLIETTVSHGWDVLNRI